MPVQCLSCCRCLPCLACFSLESSRASPPSLFPCHVVPHVTSPPVYPRIEPAPPSFSLAFLCLTPALLLHLANTLKTSLLCALSKTSGCQQTSGLQTVGALKMSSWNKSSIREKRLGDCKKDPVFNLLYLRRLEHTLYIRITTSPATLQRVTGEYDKCKSSVISAVSTRGAACCPTWGSLPRNSRLVLDSCSRRRRPTCCS